MTKFNIRKQLPSVKVDKELIEQIENYIIHDLSTIIEIDNESILENYSLEIIDSLGTEEFNRISEFPINNFQNGTKQIKLGFGYYKNSVTRIFVSFSIHKNSSELEISLDSSHSREKAQGIYNGILDRINTNKTYNSIFHNFLTGIIGGIGVGLMFQVVFLLVKEYYVWSIYLFMCSLLLIFIGAKIEKYKPYSEFLSQRQQQYNRVFSFFIWGIISYLVFGIGLGLLQNQFLN